MHSTAPLSAVIPVLDGAALLPACLTALEEGRRQGLIDEILVVDGGSRDATPEIAVARGARLLEAPRGRGTQLAAGGAAARGDWLLFLHADTRLAAGWPAIIAAFIEDPANQESAGYCRLRLDDEAPAARRLEQMVRLRSRWLGLPYGDQGLLLARRFYEALGGYRAMPLMEDVDLVRRIGRGRLRALDVLVTSSAARYRREGYLVRPLRNLACLGLYYLGLPPRLIAKLYA